MKSFIRQAEEIFDKLMPRRNEIHPFQKQWEEGFSCSSEDLIKEIATKLSLAYQEGVEDATRMLEEITKNDTNATVVYHSRNVAKAIRVQLKGAEE